MAREKSEVLLVEGSEEALKRKTVKKTALRIAIPVSIADSMPAEVPIPLPPDFDAPVPPYANFNTKQENATSQDHSIAKTERKTAPSHYVTHTSETRKEIATQTEHVIFNHFFNFFSPECTMCWCCCKTPQTCIPQCPSRKTLPSPITIPQPVPQYSSYSPSVPPASPASPVVTPLTPISNPQSPKSSVCIPSPCRPQSAPTPHSVKPKRSHSRKSRPAKLKSGHPPANRTLVISPPPATNIFHIRPQSAPIPKLSPPQSPLSPFITTPLQKQDTKKLYCYEVLDKANEELPLKLPPILDRPQAIGQSTPSFTPMGIEEVQLQAQALLMLSQVQLLGGVKHSEQAKKS